MQRIIKSSLILLLALTMVACTGETATSTADEELQSQNSTDQDTSQIDDSANEDTDQTTAPSLTQTYTSEPDAFPVGSVSFDYPDGWVVSSPFAGMILVATSESVANKTFSTSAFDTGEAVIQLGLNTRTNSDEAITDHVTGFAGGIGIPLGEASEITLGENLAARVDGSNNNRYLMVVSVLFDDAVDVAAGSGDTYIDAVTYSNPGEFDQMEATLLAIIETINYADSSE